MNRILLLALAFCIITAPLTLAQQLPPPQNPAAAKPPLPPQAPALPPAARGLARPQPKNPGKPPEFFAARRQAQIDRKQAAKQRMQQFKAARAVAEEKLYQDWHERYLADAPVRVEYYRALARAYEADAALAYSTPYFYNAAPPIVLIPVYSPIYAPIYQPATYGTYFYWGW
jgi:hypothetical protein